MRILLLALALALAGCAAQPSPATPATPEAETPELTRARIHTQLGAVYYSRGQLGVALQELGEALRAKSDYAPAHNVLGLVYVELREYGRAEINFKRAIAIDPLDSDAHHNYGSFLCQQGREDEGIRQFLDAMKNPLYRTPDKSYAAAGQCARKKGDLALAEDFYEKALRIQPSQRQALYGLADLRFRAGRAREAKDYLNRYMQGGASEAESLLLGVQIERQLGDRDAAASYELQLRKRYPDSKEAKSLTEGAAR